MAKPIALQLYTVREACQQDFPATLRKVAEIGYKGVEFAGLHGMSAAEVKKLIDDLGLEVAGSHSPLPNNDNIKEIVEQERTLGATKIVSGYGPDQFKKADDIKWCADQFNQAVEVLKPTGIQLGYHNHWWEFNKIDGKLGLDLFLEQAPNVFSELDVYWAATGGTDPAEYLKKLGNRAKLLHIKDGPAVEGEPHTAVGSGKVDIPAVIAQGGNADYLIVELDACATDMMEAVEKSYHYLVGNGLAEGNKPATPQP